MASRRRRSSTVAGRSGTDGRGGSSPGWLKKAAISDRQSAGFAAGPAAGARPLPSAFSVGLGLRTAVRHRHRTPAGPGRGPTSITRDVRANRNHRVDAPMVSPPLRDRACRPAPFQQEPSPPAPLDITNRTVPRVGGGVGDESRTRWMDAPSSYVSPDLSRSYDMVSRHGKGCQDLQGREHGTRTHHAIACVVDSWRENAFLLTRWLKIPTRHAAIAASSPIEETQGESHNGEAVWRTVDDAYRSRRSAC